jgi:hypothetical protein
MFINEEEKKIILNLKNHEFEIKIKIKIKIKKILIRKGNMMKF